MYKKKSNAGLVSTICILLIIVLVVGFLGFVTSGFKNWDTKTWFEKENVEEPPAVDNEGNELEMGKVYSLPSSLSFRRTSTTTESGITLQATILPTNATEKAVDWSVDWVENTGFAEGKNVSEYVTVTPSEDGSNVAVVNCLQPFGTQIKIVVTSRDNEEKKAECLVDYLADSYRTVVNIATETNNYTFDSTDTEFVYLPLGFYGSDSILSDVSEEVTGLGIYTKIDNISEERPEFLLTDDFIVFMNTMYSSHYSPNNLRPVSVVTGLNMDLSFFWSLLGVDSHSSLEEDDIAKAIVAYQAEGNCPLKLKIYTVARTNFFNEIPFKIDLSSIYVSVSDITIDNDNIVF